LKNILIINGPNLNLLGRRQPHIYGSTSFEDYYTELADKYKGRVNLSYFQSNHEGSLIDKLHEVGFDYDAIILNAGGYTHTSIALADAVAAISTPVGEVHISDINSREPYRQHSYLTAVCTYHVMGEGLAGYESCLLHYLQQPTLLDN